MKNNMEEIDSLIKETLNQEEAKFYDDLNEEGLFGMVRSLFKGKLKWVIVMMITVNFIVLGFLIYAFIQFFNATETFELIKWTVAIFVGLMMMSMLKLFSWMQMNKNALMREIKRLELLISSLTHK
tara:strand:- start:1409 stop:1786 length:378 start_codon:yes stop_codon:yes gene_type:complete